VNPRGRPEYLSRKGCSEGRLDYAWTINTNLLSLTLLFLPRGNHPASVLGGRWFGRHVVSARIRGCERGGEAPTLGARRTISCHWTQSIRSKNAAFGAFSVRCRSRSRSGLDPGKTGQGTGWPPCPFVLVRVSDASTWPGRRRIVRLRRGRVLRAVYLPDRQPAPG
jgi:hypothetical protein